MLMSQRRELERACNRLVNNLEDVIDDGASRPMQSIVYVCGHMVTISAVVEKEGVARAVKPGKPKAKRAAKADA